jgi:hypothetical protein
VRTGIDTLGAENAIAVTIHAPAWILKHRTPVGIIAAFKAALCLALAADFGVPSPNLKGCIQRGNADEGGEWAMVKAKGPSLKKE